MRSDFPRHGQPVFAAGMINAIRVMMDRLASLPGPVLAALTGLAILPALAMAYGGTRLLQVLILALSAWLLIWRPSQRRPVKQLQLGAALLLLLSFLLDSVVRGFILSRYGAVPDSTMVTTSIANTSAAEATEFIVAFWPALALWAGVFVGSASIVVLLLAAWWRKPGARVQTSRRERAAFAVLLLMMALALAIRPWRHHHPLAFWPAWATQIARLQEQWHSAELQHETVRQRASADAPVLTRDSPDTLVLVITDSVNRNHLSVYGYPRETTPKLAFRRESEPDNIKIFRHAWSADASTVLALNNFFHFGEPQRADRHHLLALVAAAGYKTWWISNHDDLAVYKEHSVLADHMAMVNNFPGRSTTSLDQQVLAPLDSALRDEARRKFIVVHLLGAHPHYANRFPSGRTPFHDREDVVYQSLKKEGRSFWAIDSRNNYDAALHFHDEVLDHIFELTARSGKKTSLMFLSDHGQEVGSMSDHAGHSASSADGYRIPLIVWGGLARPLREEIESVPVRSDWLGYSVIRMLGLRWKGYQTDKDVLHPGYQWLPPKLPISVDYRS